MKKIIAILLLVILAFSCVSYASSKENSATSSKENFMMANEIKTHVIYGGLSDYYSDSLNKKLDTWLREHRNAKIIEIQYDGNIDGDYSYGNVLIIYQ